MIKKVGMTEPMFSATHGKRYIQTTGKTPPEKISISFDEFLAEATAELKKKKE